MKRSPAPSDSIFGLFVDSFLITLLILGGAIAIISWLRSLTSTPQVQAEYVKDYLD